MLARFSRGDKKKIGWDVPFNSPRGRIISSLLLARFQ